MRKIALLITLINLTSCGLREIENPLDKYPSIIEKEFELFSSNFFDYHDNMGLKTDYNVSILMSKKLPDNVFGRCKKVEGDNKRVILINEKAWGNLSTATKEMIIFHEMGHCILDRNHVEETYLSWQSGLAVSMMYPIDLNRNIYSINRDYYIAELFGDDPVEFDFNTAYYENEELLYNENDFLLSYYPTYRSEYVTTASLSLKSRPQNPLKFGCENP